MHRQGSDITREKTVHICEYLWTIWMWRTSSLISNPLWTGLSLHSSAVGVLWLIFFNVSFYIFFCGQSHLCSIFKREIIIKEWRYREEEKGQGSGGTSIWWLKEIIRLYSYMASWFPNGLWSFLAPQTDICSSHPRQRDRGIETFLCVALWIR